MKTMTLGATMGVFLALWQLVGCGATQTHADAASSPVVDGYDYAGAEPAAIAAYQQGFSYILDEGRWTASEAAFREAARLDPDWVMGKTLVARITQDLQERERLLAEIEAGYAGAPEDSRLILEVFLMNIRAANARDRGEQMPEGFAAQRRAVAVENFGLFCERHPGETYLQLERLEWVHNVEGAEATLALMETLPEGVLRAPSFAGLEATLRAELGEMDAAWAAFARFEGMVDDRAPAVAYLRAQLLNAQGDVAGALAAAERAVKLDPKHVLAVRMRDWLRGQ